jgi:hypothetical protein
MSHEVTQKRIFISHSSIDTWVAKQIAREVSACGATPFLDEAEIEVGAKFEVEIRESLDRAHELLVLLTPWALRRPYIWAELGAAWIRQIPIVGILHGVTHKKLQSDPKITVFLKEHNLIDINDLDRYFEQLKARVTAQQVRKEPDYDVA